MESPGEKWTAAALLRSALVAIVWAVWIPCIGARRLLELVWEGLHAPFWRRTWLWWGIPGIAVLVAAIQMGPLLYGRYALLDAARHQAKTSWGRDSRELVEVLRREALRRGYEVQHEEAFSIESDRGEDGLDLCIIQIRLHRKLKLLGCIPMTFAIQKRVSSPVMPVDFKEKKARDRVIVE